MFYIIFIFGLCCSLRISLVHETTQVRAGTLRAVRYILQTEADVIAFNSLRLPYLITRYVRILNFVFFLFVLCNFNWSTLFRSLDVVLRNEMERIQALRVVRRIIRLSASRCEASIARALVAVPSASPDDKDRMLRAYLAALCELGNRYSIIFYYVLSL